MWQARVLAKDVTAATFRYFAALDRMETPVWRSEWRNQRWLPRLVEITLKRTGGKTTLAAAPRLNPPPWR